MDETIETEKKRNEHREAFEVWLDEGANDIELIDALGIKPTIGQLLGIASHTFSITNDRDDKVQLTVNVDFRTASDTDCRIWEVSNRIIAGQRPWRSLTKAELEKMNGSTFIAQNIGKKVKPYEETKAEAINMYDLMTAEQQKTYREELEQLAKECIDETADEDETPEE